MKQCCFQEFIYYIIINYTNIILWSYLKVHLQDASYADEEMHLSWLVEPASSMKYRCTGVSVARDGSPAKQVACHRSPPNHVIIKGLKINPLEKYKYVYYIIIISIIMSIYCTLSLLSLQQSL